jgi:hypothetical protein
MSNTRSRYEVTSRRAAVGLASGAVCGAVLVVGFELVLSVADGVAEAAAGRTTVIGSAFASAAPIFVLSFLVAFVAYGAGLVCLAGPLWALLHVYGARSAPVAVLLGAALNGGVIFLLYAGVIEPRFFRLVAAAAFALAGAIVGFIVWRVAYRRATPIEDFA